MESLLAAYLEELWEQPQGDSMRVRVCMRACVRACVHVYACVCVLTFDAELPSQARMVSH